ncbi:hypothetical protein C8D88_12820 [Lentzea atacamensis]|uniref:Uncharacterized protein n=1 Tax=Lentzea atacamensis TaxID=531938 RepID=A0A316HDE8_9PSEU|nr:hypothetical protein C8D88_12820 [Lentzea atacamensis]
MCWTGLHLVLPTKPGMPEQRLHDYVRNDITILITVPPTAR